MSTFARAGAVKSAPRGGIGAQKAKKTQWFFRVLGCRKALQLGCDSLGLSLGGALVMIYQLSLLGVLDLND